MNSGPLAQANAGAPAERAGAAETLSAWLDGELAEHEADAVLAGLLREPALQQRFAGWCMVGDALRSREVLDGHSPRLCARIRDALDQEPALLAPAALRPGLKRHLTTGFAVAAAAAVLVLVAVPQLRSAGEGSGAAATIANANVNAAAGGPSAPVAPAAPALASVNRPARDPRLDPYFQAHHDFMGAGVMPAAAVYLRSGNEGER